VGAEATADGGKAKSAMKNAGEADQATPTMNK